MNMEVSLDEEEIFITQNSSENIITDIFNEENYDCNAIVWFMLVSNLSDTVLDHFL